MPSENKTCAQCASLVKCDTCKHMIQKIDSQQILYYHDIEKPLAVITLNYCPEHKKPYDLVRREQRVLGRGYFSPSNVDCYYKSIPAHEQEVDSSGDEL